MEKISINVPATASKQWHGRDFAFDVAAMDASWHERIFAYGLRVVNDSINSALKGELPSAKGDELAKMIAAINSGEAWEGTSRGGTSGLSPVDRRALSLAKDALKLRFKKLTGKAKIVEMCQASERVAVYFNGTVWIDAEVMDWLEGQVEVHDYKAQAAEQLADEKALAESIDLDDF